MKSIAAIILLLASMCFAAKAQEAKFKVELLPTTPALEASVVKALRGCTPTDGKVIAEINKNGIYTLTGDLFHDHHTYAVVDDNQDVLLCEWANSAWNLVSAINVQTVWNSPSGYLYPIVGRGPDNQPQPFWMLNLQGQPLLVIASYVEKEGQNYYVLLFDSSRKQLLDWDSSFGKRPEVKDRYLLTGNSSRVKADWDATYYSRIKIDKLVVLKSWEDSMPWHAEDHEGELDDTSNYASSSDRGYLILPDNSKSAHPADYIVVRSNPKEKRPEIPLPTGLGGRPYAAVYFTPNRITQGDDGLVYLFEKLTQLPGTLYPSWGELGVTDPNGKPDCRWKVRIIGTDQSLVNLLSLPPSNGATKSP